MAYNKNRNYTQHQIVDMLYQYMVVGEKATNVCINILNIPASKVGSPRTAYKNFESIYHSYGFMKRYTGLHAFDKISWNKLNSYVSLYWNKNATEKDLLAYFPEIAYDLENAKNKQAEKDAKSGGWGSSGSKNNSNKNKSNSYRSNNSKPSNRNSYSNNNNNSYSNGGNSGEDDGAAVVGGILFIIFAIALVKTGCFGLFKIAGIFGHAVGGVFGTLFWILELICFYGGIIVFIASIIKRRVRYIWRGALGLVLMGIGFGSLAEASIIAGIVLIAVGAILVESNYR